ncbi:DNA-binding response regulator [Aeromicrobium phragmitis]|uniref:DNA-binding response regulator n=1 Tax=Aeromicrobium phragmitis TaxID=2478914 RepID=A0A3L8PPT8_9ACTN|nr:response regulator transcription factor [Aeromicrobium phragmitis]RLV57387.1 DNA-binding response regulator [Aeromicrobium phragmitis]
MSSQPDPRAPAAAGSPRGKALETLLNLHHDVPFTAALLTYRVRDSDRDVPLLVHRMSREHVQHGLDYFIPASPDFRWVIDHRDEVLDWNSVPSFRETVTAREVLLEAGYTQGSSFAFHGTEGIIGTFHLNVSHTENLSAAELGALYDASVALEGVVRAANAAARAGLTDREVEVLHHLARGRSNQEIADELYVARRTVATHVESILAKLGVANRVQAVVTAIALGLVDADLA